MTLRCVSSLLEIQCDAAIAKFARQFRFASGEISHGAVLNESEKDGASRTCVGESMKELLPYCFSITVLTVS